jgi:hypothetical protein
MGYLFYDVLGGTARGSLSSTGPFTNVQPFGYWSATEYAPNTGDAWGFSFGGGYQGYDDNAVGLYAWAVLTGDVGATANVPEPGTISLMLSGLAMVGFAVRRRLAHR